MNSPVIPTRRAFRLRWWHWTIIGGACFFIALLIAVSVIVPLSSDAMRLKLIEALAQRFDATVELDSLHLRVVPQLHADGAGLSIRHRGRQDVPPLISVASFTVDTGLLTVLHRHVSEVHLTGLDIQIPPDHGPIAGGKNELGETDGAGSPGGAVSTARDLVIDTLTSSDAKLAILPAEAGKNPKVWNIHQLRMHSVGISQAMPFEATLTNAVPPGDIETSGHFGPWQTDDPGATPLDGGFTFERADLGVFDGIAGILSAHGTFGGALGRLDIHGETDTPEFTVKVSGHPVALHAKYHAIVDGTNGDTILERIDATFLKTSLVAKGAVVDTPGKEGRTVNLDIDMEKARLEDVLTLAVPTPEPPMIGGLKLKTKFVLPPGKEDVVRKLRLEGTFEIDGSHFTDPKVQTKINELSQRSQGKPDEAAARAARSDFQGRFKLGHGVLDTPALAFNIPGAVVRLTGKYGLQSETLDYTGTVYMQAKISETVTGFRHFLLKLVDPFFKHEGGGSAIPIKINGKRSDPNIGLDRSRLFKHK